MLKSIQGMDMITQCNCGKEKTTDLTGVVISKGDFDQWDNLTVNCECGIAEAFNLNIPIDDTDEPFATGDLPTDEEIQRYYVRLLIRIVRADFQAE